MKLCLPAELLFNLCYLARFTCRFLQQALTHWLQFWPFFSPLVTTSNTLVKPLPFQDMTRLVPYQTVTYILGYPPNNVSWILKPKKCQKQVRGAPLIPVMGGFCASLKKQTHTHFGEEDAPKNTGENLRLRCASILVTCCASVTLLMDAVQGTVLWRINESMAG